MRLRPDERLFGVDPAILIDAARQLHHRDGAAFVLKDMCLAMGAPPGEVLPVLNQMVSEGFVELDMDSQETYRATKKLGQLALAHISTGLQRVHADELLQRVIAQVEAINANPDRYQCKVIRVVVFGSYLGQKAILGDLDIGVEIKEVLPSSQEDRVARFRDWRRGRATPVSKAQALLRLRKPKLISIHDFEEVKRLDTPYRVVWDEPLDPQPQAS